MCLETFCIIILYLTCISLFIYTLYYSYPVYNKTSMEKMKVIPMRQYYNGLVIFDIDGTLAVENNENEAVVQACIDNNFAVGIATAGSIYNMGNILSYKWMPKNLYNFIKQHNDATFNNVASGVLMGRFNPYPYLGSPNRNPGYLKGIAMEKTGKAFNINNPRKIILCDDSSYYLQGAREYNPNFTLLCAGENCGGKLTLQSIKQVLNKVTQENFV